jgi:hypothetical protein
MTVIFQAETKRRCGDCQLCCRLLPMKRENKFKADRTLEKMIAAGLAPKNAAAHMIDDFDKPAGQRCKYQRHHKGCTVYAKRPFGCRMWSCRWLLGDDTADLSRPDRTGYVLDAMPDFITLESEDGQPRTIEVVQIWVDQEHPEAWREPKLLAFLERRAKEGIGALIRRNHRDAVAVFGPGISHDGQWHYVESGSVEEQHTEQSLWEGLERAREEREKV